MENKVSKTIVAHLNIMSCQSGLFNFNQFFFEIYYLDKNIYKCFYNLLFKYIFILFIFFFTSFSIIYYILFRIPCIISFIKINFIIVMFRELRMAIAEMTNHLIRITFNEYFKIFLVIKLLHHKILHCDFSCYLKCQHNVLNHLMAIVIISKIFLQKVYIYN